MPHPFDNPTTQRLDSPDGENFQFAPDAPGVLAVVLSVVNVTGGQRITYREATSTSRANANPVAAPNALVGEAMVPEAFGKAVAGRLVMLFSLPCKDEMFAAPVNRLPFSYVENASFNATTCVLTKTIRTIFISAVGLRIEDA